MTGGGNYPNDVDKEAYHFLVDKDGEVHYGIHKVEDNLDCNDGNYAAHCGGGNTGCYDKLTEVLTDSGWKHFEDIDIEKDKFFTMDICQNPSYQYATEKFKYRVKDNLLSFKNKTCDLLVTSNHNMVMLSEKTGKNYFKTAQEISNYCSVSIPMNKPIESSLPKYFTLGETKIEMKTWLMFLGLYVAEGCCSKKGNKNNNGSELYRVTISQSKKANPDKYAMIIKMLDSLPFNYCIQKNNIEIHNKELCLYLRKLGYSHERYIPNEFKKCSLDELNILWYWLMMGDGCFGTGNTEHYYTTSKRLVDDLQEILATHGFRSVVYTKNPRDKYIKNHFVKKENQKICYELVKLRRKNTFLENDFFNYVPYDDFVYCVTVPNHTLLTRRNGKIQWSGNSIGVALCGMMGFNNSMKFTKYPLTRKQFEAAFLLCAELCKKYKLKPNQVITHAEFGLKFPNTSSKGKSDISYIPYLSLEGVEKIGSYVRNKVNWYYSKLKK